MDRMSEWGNHDTLLLEADLLVEGIRATGYALRCVGNEYKEQNHSLFGWDFEDHGTEMLPDDFLLHDGTVVQFRENSRSRFFIDRSEDDTLRLTENRKEFCPVSWIPRLKDYN